MRRYITWFIVVVAAALIQTTWLDAIRLQGVLPDLAILLVVFFAISQGEERAMFTGALAGMYQDVTGNAVLGHHVLCLVVVGYMVGRIARRLVLEHPIIKVVLVMCASTISGILFTIIQYVQTPRIHPFHDIAVNVIPAAFYTALVTPIAFALLGLICRRTDETFAGSMP